MARQEYIIVTVQGSFRFPIDMMRYDQLHPYEETDSYRIQHSLDQAHVYCECGEKFDSYAAIKEHIAAATEGYHTEVRNWKIRLGRYAERKWQPTWGRWQSFSWEVVDVVPTGRVL